MKHRFFTIALCVATLSFVNGSAQEAKLQRNVSPSSKQLIPKGSDSPSFLKANGTSHILLNGDPAAPSTSLTFSKNVLIRGKGIKAKKNGHEFVLEKGSYLVYFTGTFQALGPLFNPATQEFGFKLNSQVLSPQSNLEFIEGNPFATRTISTLIKVKKKSTLSVVARDITSGTQTQVTVRTLSISRLND